MPAATFNRFRCFSLDVLSAKHNFTSDATCSVTVALTAAANAPVATNTVLANLTEVAYTNLSSRVITNISMSNLNGVTTVTGDTLVITASGGPSSTFRYVVLFNDDATGDALMGWMDLGGDVTLADGQTLTIRIQETGIFTLTINEA
jgi:hypothetical protein